MQYVVFDLEWNNVYGRKINGFINEIIEIGAVRVSGGKITDTFESFVNPEREISEKITEIEENFTHD